MHYTISLHYRSRDTAYRDAFRPNTISETPYFAIAAFGAVGDDEAEALQHWHAHGAGDRRSEASTGAFLLGLRDDSWQPRSPSCGELWCRRDPARLLRR